MVALSDKLVQDKVLSTGRKKAVIFTQFVDTATYVYQNLKNDLKDKRVEILTGSTDEDSRKRILMEFAPVANNSRSVKHEVDVLVCTDVLSEGQNLQDCTMPSTTIFRGTRCGSFRGLVGSIGYSAGTAR